MNGCQPAVVLLLSSVPLGGVALPSWAPARTQLSCRTTSYNGRMVIDFINNKLEKLGFLALPARPNDETSQPVVRTAAQEAVMSPSNLIKTTAHQHIIRPN